MGAIGKIPANLAGKYERRRCTEHSHLWDCGIEPVEMMTKSPRGDAHDYTAVGSHIYNKD